MSYMPAERKRRIGFGEDGDALMMLIIINVLVFIVITFLEISFMLLNKSKADFAADILSQFMLPAKLSAFIVKPWVFVSHMFSHVTVWGLLGNMLFLWAFGYLLQDLTSTRHIIPLYLYGCIVGAVLFMASANLLPRFAQEIDTFTYTGAAAGTMAVALAVTITAPDYRVFPMINGGIPLWVITLIYIIIDFAGLATQSFPHHLAHLAGALIGFLYIKQVQRGNDWGVWMHRFYHWLTHLFEPSDKKTKQPVSKQLFYKTKNKEPYTRTPTISQKRIDEILDKISQKGYDSLSKEEKDILKKAGEDDQP